MPLRMHFSCRKVDDVMEIIPIAPPASRQDCFPERLRGCPNTTKMGDVMGGILLPVVRRSQ